MKKILLVAALLIVCGPVAAQAMGDLYVSGTWRYKMTVVVETPEGIKTGSAVREVSNSTSSIKLDLPQATNAPAVKGEAVVVDLGKRGVLFGLISPDSYDELYSAFPIKMPSTAEGIRYYNSLPIGAKAILPNNKLWLVTFRNINDPQSIKTVAPEKLSEFFGENVMLKEIIIELTQNPVTWGSVENYLPWFGKEKIGLRFADPKRPDPVNYLTGSSFKLGEER